MPTFISRVVPTESCPRFMFISSVMGGEQPSSTRRPWGIPNIGRLLSIEYLHGWKVLHVAYA